MVAIPREEVVGRSQEFVRGFAKSCVDLFLGCEGEAVQNLAFEGSAGRFRLGFRPVHASQAGPIVAAVGIFPTVYNDTGVK